MKTQQEKILALLRQMGSRGINSYDLTYVHSIKQAPTRIKELREMGYEIVSRTIKGNRSVQYILLNIGNAPKQTTAPKYNPFEEQENLVRVEKIINGEKRYFWEKPKDVEPKQEAMF